ncbi:MAG: hypothetical protein DDT30_01430 [Dehalococcoidia bacterium]|nr:hypothetical protein [Bacillota bacterium]MBT9142930.1 hypothetical protein [Bacillota bacterium]
MPCGGCAKPTAFCSICGHPIMSLSKKFPEIEPDGAWVDDEPVCVSCLQKIEKSV